jgi:hypothetical protein
MVTIHAKCNFQFAWGYYIVGLVPMHNVILGLHGAIVWLVPFDNVVCGLHGGVAWMAPCPM